MDNRFEDKGGYFRVKYVGVRTLGKIQALLEEVEANASRTQIYKYLFDLRESEEGFSTLDKYNLGIYIAKLFGRKYRVATLNRKDQITGFLENVASNRGAVNFMITDDEEKAIQWMAGDNIGKEEEMPTAMRTEFTVTETHIRFDCYGVFSRSALLELIGMVKIESERSHKKVLVNLKNLEGDMDTLTRYALGTEVAAQLAGRRIAVIGDRAKINKVGENTAINRGASMFVTHDEDEALAWLLKHGPRGPKE